MKPTAEEILDKVAKENGYIDATDMVCVSGALDKVIEAIEEALQQPAPIQEGSLLKRIYAFAHRLPEELGDEIFKSLKQPATQPAPIQEEEGSEYQKLRQVRLNYFTGVHEQYLKEYEASGNPNDLKIAAYHEGRKDEILQVPVSLSATPTQPATQPQEGELYRWVKAEERLPIDEKSYPLRIDSDTIYTGSFCNDLSQDVVCYVSSNDGGFSLWQEEFYRIEWLEQLSPQPIKEGELHPDTQDAAH